MNYALVADGVGHVTIVDVHQSMVGARKRRVPFTAENSRRLGGIFDEAIKQWRKAQKRLGMPFSFRAYLLGYVGASEYADGSDQLKSAVMHTTLNWERSNRWGWTLEKMLIPDGRFGEQVGRYASTSNPPSLRDIKIAQAVLAEEIEDPTSGAIQFDAPRTQRILHKMNPDTYKPPEKIAKERRSQGLQAVYLAKEDPEIARFWRPVYVASL